MKFECIDSSIKGKIGEVYPRTGHEGSEQV